MWAPQRTPWGGGPDTGRGPRPDLRRGRTVDIRFGTPMPVPAGADLVEATGRLGVALTGILESVQRLPVHRPRPGEHAPWYPAHLGGHAPDRREALAYDDVPHAAVSPTWGPPLDMA